VSIDIGIDEFSSEGGNAVMVSGGAVMASGGVRVGDVLARSIPIHWDEAIALLQELLDTVTSARRDDIPAFDDILIDANGVVTIHDGHRGERGPVAAGRALHALLATADVPVALRLFVTQANVPDTHASLDAFAKSLAYFGKSGRAELIRSIYARYRAAAGDAPLTPTQRPSTPPPVPVAPNDPFEPPVRRPKRALPKWAFAAVAVVVVISAFTVLWQSIRGATGQSPVGAVQSAVVAVADMLSTATTQAGSTKAAPSLPSPPSAGPGSNKSPAAARPRRDITASKAIASRETVDADAARVPAIIAYETLRAPLMPSVFESTTPTSSAALDDADPAKAIYSRVDADVQPPVMLYPQMPPPLIVGTASEGIVNSMELVIATDGSVERVRLVSEPRRMADMMLLSGAKLWRFSPAVKDGEPVRYRTTLSWTVFP
jgi:hypothetical protein